MKQLLTFVFFALFTNILLAQTGNFSVQVGAFNTKVSNDYFKGIDDVIYIKDRNDIHRYYIMALNTKAQAESRAEAARKLGYKAVIIDNDEVAKSCRVTCGAPEPSNNLNWIFFDFDKADLRSTSKMQLDRLAKILETNPTYTAELSAHTDAKGSNEYNQALSERRATNAKNYLIAKGIKAERLKTSTNGETAPIAKNDLGGADTESGRQFNRRVELKVSDAAGKAVNVVETPVIPASLKN